MRYRFQIPLLLLFPVLDGRSQCEQHHVVMTCLMELCYRVFTAIGNKQYILVYTSKDNARSKTSEGEENQAATTANMGRLGCV